MVRALRDTRWGGICPLVGLVLSSLVVASVDVPDRGAWLVWAAFVVASVTVAGALFVYGLRRWADLEALEPVELRRVLWPVGRVGILAVVGINVRALIPQTDYDWRGAVLVTVATLAGSTAAGAMYGVGLAAGGTAQRPSEGAQIDLLLSLRRLLERLLEAVGALVFLMTLQVAMSTALRVDASRPPEYVLLFGGFGSVLIALVYIPSWVALRREGQQLCDRLLPLRTLGASSDLVKAVEDRQKFAALLGYNRALVADLQSGLLIAAPLLAGATAALLAR